MMTNITRAGIVAAAILASPLAAQAADLRTPNYKAPAYTAPSYANWSGFYVGINGGYGFGKSNWNFPTLGASTGDFDVKGAMAGGTIGYNFQTGSWVWGLEGDIDKSWMTGSTAACVPNCETKNTWLGTARARLGYAAWSNWLPYLTGGAAFGDIKAEQAGATFTKTKIGYTLGAGVEYAFLGNWSAKAEYLYVDLGQSTCTAGATCLTDINVKLKANVVRAGLNYRF